MIKVTANRSNIPVEVFKFPGGEVQVKLGQMLPVGNIAVTSLPKSSDDIMTLLLVKDAIDRVTSTWSNNVRTTLSLSYLPYARQDRVANAGEALSIKVMCDLINSMSFNKVIIYDAHSDVPLSLINNLQHYDLQKCFSATAMSNKLLVGDDLDKSTTIIAPDTGASKKVSKVASKLSIPMLQGFKIRDTITGELSGFAIEDQPEFINGRDLWILDDICDGGGTFIGLAKEIKEKYNPKSINLYVTHGIFSKGHRGLDSVFDKVVSLIDWELVK